MQTGDKISLVLDTEEAFKRHNKGYLAAKTNGKEKRKGEGERERERELSLIHI